VCVGNCCSHGYQDSVLKRDADFRCV
jgi:hypothetical protein